MPVCYGVTGISVLARQIHDYMTFVVFGVIFAFSALIWLAFYTVSPKKTRHRTLAHNFPKY